MNIFLFLIFLCSNFANAAENFWNQQRRGANFFNKLETSERLKKGKEFGLHFVRLAPSKWQATGRDFLLGNVDAYAGIPPADLDRLKIILDDAGKVGTKILLTSLSSPGSRWRQQNDMQWDCRLYRDPKYLVQLSQFWEDLIRAIGDHPALAGVDPINEPFLSRCTPVTINIKEIYQSILASVRRVSKILPVIIESDNFADVQTFNSLPLFADENVLYSFHMYEPYNFTNQKINQGQYQYPGVIPTSDGVEKLWNKRTLAEYLQPVINWQQEHKVPSHRIVAGEFGCNRVVSGCQEYLADLIDVFNEHGWHWSFYSFREDTWPGMDYELGTKRLTEAQWQLLEDGGTLEYPSVPSGIASMLKKKFRGDSPFCTYEDYQ